MPFSVVLTGAYFGESKQQHSIFFFLLFCVCRLDSCGSVGESPSVTANGLKRGDVSITAHLKP